MFNFHLIGTLSFVALISTQVNQGSCSALFSSNHLVLSTTVQDKCVEYASGKCHIKEVEMLQHEFYACCRIEFNNCMINFNSNRNGIGYQCQTILVPVTFCYDESNCEVVHVEVQTCSK